MLCLGGSFVIAFSKPVEPVIYDIRSLHVQPVSLEQRQQAYQALHALAALQGIVNKHSPTLMYAFSSQ